MALTFKAARVNANLTQREACKRLGVTNTTLCNWEKGRSYPSVLQAKQMADLYGIGINDFLLP